ncbi:MAG: hypothetical protein ACRDAX_04640 [Propionibacteriaceae bacterium]
MAHGAPLKVGEKVWLHISVPAPGTSAKLHREWSGPYVILKVLSNTTCLIKDERDNTTRPMTVHFNRLKPYEGWTTTVCDRADLTQLPDVGAEVEIPYDSEAPRAELI